MWPSITTPIAGNGSWQKTVDSIEILQAHGFQVRISTTETPANTGHIDQVCALHRSLGIPEQDHFIRPLAKRGYSKEGIELEMGNLMPEVTVNLDGVFWHPLSTDADMQISKQMFPLSVGGRADPAAAGRNRQHRARLVDDLHLRVRVCPPCAGRPVNSAGQSQIW